MNFLFDWSLLNLALNIITNGTYVDNTPQSFQTNLTDFNQTTYDSFEHFDFNENPMIPNNDTFFNMTSNHDNITSAAVSTLENNYTTVDEIYIGKKNRLSVMFPNRQFRFDVYNNEHVFVIIYNNNINLSKKYIDQAKKEIKNLLRPISHLLNNKHDYCLKAIDIFTSECIKYLTESAEKCELIQESEATKETFKLGSANSTDAYGNVSMFKCAEGITIELEPMNVTEKFSFENYNAKFSLICRQ